MQDFPAVFAHRGASAYAPENTLVSFEEAKKRGASWIEYDIQLCRSGDLVVIHDETLDRTTTGKGAVAEFAAEELARWDAGSWFDPRFAHARIPTLKETLQLMERLQLGANIEAKPLPGQEKQTAHCLYELLKQACPSNIPLPVISSFSLEFLRCWAELKTPYPLGVLFDKLPEDAVDIAKGLSAWSIHLNQEHIAHAQLIEHLRRKGFLVAAYTVNDPQRGKELWSWGVNGIFTDCPGAPF